LKSKSVPGDFLMVLECLWQFQTPTSRIFRIVPCGNFTNEILLKASIVYLNTASVLTCMLHTSPKKWLHR
jgi:hypothetical protein